MKPTTPEKRASFNTAQWEEIKKTGANDNDFDNRKIEELFDERPTYNDPPEPGFFKKIYTAISHSTAVKKISGFFQWIGAGVSNAASYVKSIFSKPQDQATALRHVREPSDISEMIQAASQELISHSSSEAVPPSFLVKDGQSNSLKMKVKDKEEISDDPQIASQQDTRPVGNTSSPMEANERAFKWWMSEFSRDGDQAICQTNFETAAKARAQEIYDHEVMRCKAFADKPNEYFLSTDDRERLEAAAALLHKKPPLPPSLKEGPGVKVARFSPDEAAHFFSWQTWKNSGSLPEEGDIRLDLAVQFADEFIAAHTTEEDKSNKEIAKTLQDAFDLIAHKPDYALKLASARGVAEAGNLLASMEALSMDALPEHSSTNDSSLTPRWTFPSIDKRNQEIMRQAIAPEMTSREFSRMLIMAGLFLDAKDSGHSSPEGSQAFALTLASLWEKALKDPDRLETLRALEDFGVLKQLLVMDTIESMPLTSDAARQKAVTEPGSTVVAGPPAPPPSRIRKEADAGPPPPPPPRRQGADRPPMAVDTVSAVLSEQSQDASVQPSLPKFPSEAGSLTLGLIRSNYALAELRVFIQGARRYFNALERGREPVIDDKASAITLANLWDLAKSDRATELAMQELEFFKDLDQLLQAEKIRTDFR